MDLLGIRREIRRAPENADCTARGWEPVYTANSSARLLIIGQAPGRIAQETNVPWTDKSGDNLRSWLGLSRDEFYDETRVALVPMDFYFPGSRERGDAPPRKGFADQWHPLILGQMPHITLTILIGQYSQEKYLGTKRKDTLTETVRAYRDYLPSYVPLVHPSPRNNIWIKRNPWFSEEVLPAVRDIVRSAITP